MADEETMAKYYAASDICLYPSVADNCPLIVLEALACGLPVITFNTGGIPELVAHLKTGYIAEYKNVEDLAKGAELFLNDRDLREKAGILARKKVKESFTLDHQTDEYLKLCRKIIS